MTGDDAKRPVAIVRAFFCDGETYNPDGICGQCRKDGKSYDG